MLFLDDFTKIKDSKILIIPILRDHQKHYVHNEISFIYIYGLETYNEYIINLHHNDCRCVEICGINNFLGTEVYCYRKKYLSTLPLKLDALEAELVYWFKTNKRLTPDIPSQVQQYWSWYRNVNNLNDCIPIMKWLEYCRDVKDRFVVQYNNFELTNSFVKYNELLGNLEQIERNGLSSGTVFEFCEYNPFTLTGRPSNHFDNINYAALNKTDGSRRRFISRHEMGFLVEIDMSGFHLYLIYTILGMKFPKNVYEELSKYYPAGEDPKTYTFKQIYGGITEDLRGVEPFKSISNLSKNTFINYKTGNLKTFLYERPIIDGIVDEDNQTRIFNYMLQNLETEFNNELLTKINLFLQDKFSKLVLYTYDSFLIDYCLNDPKNTLKDLLDIFGDIPKHIKAGVNYHDMKNMLI